MKSHLKDVGLLSDEKEGASVCASANLRIKSRTFETNCTPQEVFDRPSGARERLLTEKNDVILQLFIKPKTLLPSFRNPGAFQDEKRTS
jgi:hypothetical protein